MVSAHFLPFYFFTFSPFHSSPTRPSSAQSSSLATSAAYRSKLTPELVCIGRKVGWLVPLSRRVIVKKSVGQAFDFTLNQVPVPMIHLPYLFYILVSFFPIVSKQIRINCHNKTISTLWKVLSNKAQCIVLSELSFTESGNYICVPFSLYLFLSFPSFASEVI